MKKNKETTPSNTGHLGNKNGIEEQPSLGPEIVSPKNLMRIRHPDLFSDSRVESIPRYPKEVFEYHLDTLTSRKQEYQFEHFCRKLAEKEICPNLRVQTGPTGGGDSKVDTETYPVAPEIAERWWIGLPSSGVERWAFAFSAKKAWKAKVKADVQNILSTGRDYTLIYFFTNQFVSDKERSAQEDKLSDKAGVPVHIVDRAWIVEKVYGANYQQLEIYLAALGVDDVQRDKTVRTGPRDAAWFEELQELDGQVADPARYQGARYQLVEDCLRSAILARSLERSRSEVEGRFAQADRFAQEVNYYQQRLRIAYDRAWTAFWWYEDYPEFNRFYEEVEQYAGNSAQAKDLGLLQNLWMLLFSSLAAGHIGDQEAKIESRSRRLKAMLKAIVADAARPNNALEARTSLILMRTIQAHHDSRFDDVEHGWCKLTDVVEQSDYLGAYSLEHLFRIVQEIGPYFEGPKFDALYEKLANATRKRRSDGEAGLAYLRRAKQKMGQEKPYQAIQWFGRAEELLTQQEYREELVVTLLGASCAYELVGLFWAARNKALAATDRALAWFIEEGKIVSQALMALNRLAWVELRLGRIPHILHAITFANFVANNLSLSDDKQHDYEEELRIQDSVLGIHLLNLPMKALTCVTRLPSALERIGFPFARMALLFVLGYEKVLRDEGHFTEEEDTKVVGTFFENWQDQPATKEISSSPVLVSGPTSTLKSTILGLRLVVETPNNMISFGIAESLLGALEAFLSTSNERDAFPRCERMVIVITTSPGPEGVPQMRFSDTDSSHIEITHPSHFRPKNASEIQDYKRWLQESILEIACRMLVIRDLSAWFEQKAAKERAFSRSLILGDALTLNSNVLGIKPAFRLADWLNQDDKSYAVRRGRPWRSRRVKSGSSRTSQFADDSSPAGVFDKEKLKHTDRRVLSPIDTTLWDKAIWRGTLFYCPPTGPPVLAIAFENGEAGQAIFRLWKERWGDRDDSNELRVAIVTGLSKGNPAEYAVVVGPNFRADMQDENEIRLVTYVSRIHRMTPSNSQNLDTFLRAYGRSGQFLFAPAEISPDGSVFRGLYRECAISKRELDVRPAWKIGNNDPDLAVFREDDDPIIPAGIEDVPVTSAMKRVRVGGVAR